MSNCVLKENFVSDIEHNNKHLPSLSGPLTVVCVCLVYKTVSLGGIFVDCTATTVNVGERFLIICKLKH